MNDQLSQLDELEPEEAHPTSDLDSLDDLLNEAVTIAEARKQTRRTVNGTKNVDPALLDIARAADAAMLWKPEYAVAHFVEEHCSCGASHKRFDGWFIVSSHHREPHARRFLRTDGHQDLPTWQYITERDLEFCAECVSEFALPLATLDLLTGIEALGTPAACCIDSDLQTTLDLDLGEQLDETDPLNELDELLALE